MNATDFFTGNNFGLFIDLRSMTDNDLHGSGMKLIDTKEGVQLAIYRKSSSSGKVKYHISIVSDAQLNITKRELESGTYLSDTYNLQRHSFGRRTNQGTPWLLCEKIQHWYLKIFTHIINTLSATLMARQEDHSGWWYSHPLQKSQVRHYDMWILYNCGKFQLPLKSRYISKCAKTIFF